MEDRQGDPANVDQQQPEQQVVDQAEKVPAQGEQGVQRIIQKICYLCPGGNKMWSLNWARHMKNIHPGKRGIRNVDWCYVGEEMMMDRLKVGKDAIQQR